MSSQCIQKKRQRQKFKKELECKFSSYEKPALSSSTSSPTIVLQQPTYLLTPPLVIRVMTLDLSLTSFLKSKMKKQRKSGHMKGIILQAKKYGSFIDDTDSIPIIASSIELCPTAILNNIPTIKRIPVQKYIRGLQMKEKKAVFMAQTFRDKCEHLKRECIENKLKAQKEKEGVCYFWRNQLHEGCSRSGKLVSMALSNCKKKV